MLIYLLTILLSLLYLILHLRLNTITPHICFPVLSNNSLFFLSHLSFSPFGLSFSRSFIHSCTNFLVFRALSSYLIVLLTPPSFLFLAFLFLSIRIQFDISLSNPRIHFTYFLFILSSLSSYCQPHIYAPYKITLSTNDSNIFILLLQCSLNILSPILHVLFIAIVVFLILSLMCLSAPPFFCKLYPRYFISLTSSMYSYVHFHSSSFFIFLSRTPLSQICPGSSSILSFLKIS